MNLHMIEMVAAYSSLAVYVIGVLGFLVAVCTGGSAKHFIYGMIFAPVWPFFLAVALIREHRASKRLANKPKYVQIRR
jgi:hypothetical protein